MNARRSIFAVLALVLGLPLAAAAQSAPDPDRAGLDLATNAYFTAIAHGDPTAIDRATTAGFRLTKADGTPLDQAAFLGDLAARRLTSSTPVQSVRIGTPAIAGTSATENVDVSSFDTFTLGDRQWLERDISTHSLTLVRTATGGWLVSEDRVVSATHLV